MKMDDRLGPDEIVAPLREGVMSEVYRARDTKLKRQVALNGGDTRNPHGEWMEHSRQR
jgi:hypothetical protein